uniref:RCC1 domain-containing protein n=1 Tax=Chitinimonas sp. TaxID=1934313 RepID=UPI0035AFD27C
MTRASSRIRRLTHPLHLALLASSLALCAATPQIAARGYTSMALDASGNLYGWGDNGDGLLGRYGRSDKPLAINPAIAVARGYTGRARTFLIDTLGGLWGSGANNIGQLGDGTFFLRRSGLVKLGEQYQDLALGANHTLAIKRDGSLWAWGDNSAGQLGNGASSASAKPVALGLSKVKAVAAGSQHSLALLEDGSLWAWGDNSFGQLGDGSQTAHSTPVQVGSDYVQIAAGDDFSMALRADGTLLAWGANQRGQLGDGNKLPRAKPVQIAGSYRQIAAAGQASFAISTSGKLTAWGSNTADPIAPAAGVTLAQSTIGLAVNDQFVLLQKGDGSLYSIDRNDQAPSNGGGIVPSVLATTPVALAGEIKSFAAGGGQALLVKKDGSS